MARRLDYSALMHRALRAVIRDALAQVARDGLPGEHHFFITFATMHPDVEIADWLSDRYPGEMTIVLQHWFEHLEVTDEGFSVTLNFGEQPEPLYVPFDAIRTFLDPSVEFGLRFEADDEEAAPPAAAPSSVPAPAAPEHGPETAREGEAEVVSLDQFRKDH